MPFFRQADCARSGLPRPPGAPRDRKGAAGGRREGPGGTKPGWEEPGGAEVGRTGRGRAGPGRAGPGGAGLVCAVFPLQIAAFPCGPFLLRFCGLLNLSVAKP